MAKGSNLGLWGSVSGDTGLVGVADGCKRLAERYTGNTVVKQGTIWQTGLWTGMHEEYRGENKIAACLRFRRESVETRKI